MATRRTAFASVRNNTSGPLVAVSVVHKYSDNYKHQHQWGIIQPGEIPSDRWEVEYNTGAFTTGRDWWLVTWYSEDMKTLYYSNPNNFRGLFDTLDRTAPEAVGAAASLATKILASPTGPVGSIAAGFVAGRAAKATTALLFNTESTEGYKGHTLFEEDANSETEIIIRDNNTIIFKSKSGVSETVYASKPAPTL